MTPPKEVAREVEFHLEMRVRELVASGVEPEEARRLAALQFGGRAAIERRCAAIVRRRERRAGWHRAWTSVGTDVLFAVRRLRRRPKFAAVAILTMALGIGAATAMFSVVDGVLLRPLPFDQPDRLVSISLTDDRWRTDGSLSAIWDRIPLGRAEYDPLREHAPSLAEHGLWTEAVALMNRTGGSSSGDDQLQRVPLVRVTASILPLLRVTPVRGRIFAAGEDVLNGPKVALLGWEAWHARFGAREDAVGSSIVLDDVPYTVIGVLPAGVRLSRVSPPPVAWIPALQQDYDLPEKRNRSYRALARLAPGATPARAADEAARAFRGSFNGGPQVGARVELWQQDEARGVRGTLVMLVGAIALLLAIAGVNVSMVTLAEATTRTREVASRAALGAGTGRLVQQFLTEGLVVAMAGAAVGAGIAALAVRLAIDLAPRGVPGLADVVLDLRAFAFAGATMVIVGLASGLAPAVAVARDRVTLVDSGTRHTRHGVARLQQGLIAVEIALSFVLLVGCGLLGHSLARLQDVDVGYAPERLVVVDISGTRTFWRSSERVRQFFEGAVEAAAAIPGVQAATATSAVPFGVGRSSSPIFVEGGEPRGHTTQQVSVTPNYFTVMAVPLVAGRGFTSADSEGGELVAIVSRSAARRDFGDESPIGRRVRWQGKMRIIVGVVGDVRAARLSAEMLPTIYIPAVQSGNWTSLIVRSALPVDRLTGEIRGRLRGLDSAVAVQSVQSMPALVARSYAEERFRALLVTLFGGLAGVLAGVGVFAVTSRAVSMRLREAGIRVALGASTVAVARAMSRDILSGVGAGLALGGAGAALLARWLAPQLFGVVAWDTVAFAVAASILGGAVIAALLPPIGRAVGVDAVTALRAD